MKFLPAPLVFALLANIAPAQQPPANENTKFLESLATGYRNHRQSLREFRCRYRVTHGTTKNFDDALQGRIETRNRPVDNVIWLQRDDWVLYDQFCDKEPNTFKTGEHYVSGNQKEVAIIKDCYQYFIMFNSECGIGSTDGLRNCTIRGKGEPPMWRALLGCPNNPWTMGVMELNSLSNEPDHWITAGLSNRSIRDTGPVNVASSRGHAVHVSGFIHKDTYGDFTYDIDVVLDLDHGFLPARIDIVNRTDPNSIYTLYGRILEFKECSAGRWFPLKSVSVAQHSSEPGILRTSLFETLEFDPDTRLNDNDFQVSLEKSLHKSPNPHAYIHGLNLQQVLRIPRTIPLAQLQAFFEEMTEKQQASDREIKWINSMLAERSLQRWTAGIATTIALLTSLGWFLARRKRRLPNSP